ncbi:hypothetical protein LCGC14_0923000 [marine sediment metagenome]|uniref:AP2/ERF domain-containing protein n=1 Tax=marine sediment metagenome TaxID=412755 RepID=A0A0F9PAW4_9ZZZZ
MKNIKLTQGKFAIVDDADYVWLNQWKWCAYKPPTGGFYAKRKGSGRTILMHRQILGLGPGDKRQGDHIFHNTLDNRRNNLRICTGQENQRNRKPRSNTTSGYKGVSWHNRIKKWQVHIQVNRRRKHLGYFVLELDAALAYNKAAKELYGVFVYLNPV